MGCTALTLENRKRIPLLGEVQRQHNSPNQAGQRNEAYRAKPISDRRGDAKTYRRTEDDLAKPPEQRPPIHHQRRKKRI